MHTMAPALRSNDDRIGFLPKKWVDFLVKQPEAGPNWHLVNIKTADGGHFERVIIANCQYISDSVQAWTQIKPKEIVSIEVLPAQV